MKSLQHKRGTAAILTANNPVLAAGEFGVETDTNRIKIGDGSTAWASLPYEGINASYLTSGTLPDARLSSTVTAALTNARTPTSHASTHSSGGSDPITPASIGAAVQSDLLGSLGNPATVIDTMPRLLAFSSPSLTSGSMVLGFFTPLVTRTITQITMCTGGTTAASGLTLARMGIYTYDDSVPTGTLVAATASDTTLFAATSTLYTRSLSTGGSLPSSYTLTAGSRYAIAVLCVGTTMPQIVGQASNSATVLAQTQRISGQRTSQSDLPTGITTLSIAGTVPYARLS